MDAFLRTDTLATLATFWPWLFGKGSKSSRGSSHPNLQNAHRNCRPDVGRAKACRGNVSSAESQESFLREGDAVNGGLA
jgi:hypothetical protein